jgi:hypothetical protein
METPAATEAGAVGVTVIAGCGAVGVGGVTTAGGNAGGCGATGVVGVEAGGDFVGATGSDGACGGVSRSEGPEGCPARGTLPPLGGAVGDGASDPSAGLETTASTMLGRACAPRREDGEKLGAVTRVLFAAGIGGSARRLPAGSPTTPGRNATAVIRPPTDTTTRVSRPMLPNLNNTSSVPAMTSFGSGIGILVR